MNTHAHIEAELKKRSETIACEFTIRDLRAEMSKVLEQSLRETWDECAERSAQIGAVANSHIAEKIRALKVNP